MSGLTMGLSFGAFLLFWIIMMAAMMFPSAAPMVQTYFAISRRRENVRAGASTVTFLLGYLAVSALSGVAAFILARAAERAIALHHLETGGIARLGSVIVIAAGLYQLTPMKHFCLSKCGTPISFIMSSWRRGAAGALIMGAEHGAYCLGCCWMLLVLLFPLGMMNMVVMAAVTVLIFAEKIFHFRRKVARAAGVALVAYGLLGIVWPTALPMMLAQPPAPASQSMKM